MAGHGFGRGEYKYFAYPLPRVVAELRERLYPYLAEIADRWNRAMGIDLQYPAEHEAFRACCHSRVGQGQRFALGIILHDSK